MIFFWKTESKSRFCKHSLFIVKDIIYKSGPLDEIEEENIDLCFCELVEHWCWWWPSWTDVLLIFSSVVTCIPLPARASGSAGEFEFCCTSLALYWLVQISLDVVLAVVKVVSCLFFLFFYIFLMVRAYEWTALCVSVCLHETEAKVTMLYFETCQVCWIIMFVVLCVCFCLFVFVLFFYLCKIWFSEKPCGDPLRLTGRAISLQ